MSSCDSTTSNKSSANFIYKNIHHFSTSRSTKHPRNISNFTVSGVAVALCTKDKLSDATTKGDGRKRETSPKNITCQRLSFSSPPEIPKRKKSLRPPFEIKKIHTAGKKHSNPFINLGIRRASIREKDSPPDFIFETSKEIKKPQKSSNKKRNSNNSNSRKVLPLPVSWIDVPQPQPVDDIEILIKLFSRRLRERGRREAIHHRVEGFERLLGRMDISDKNHQCRDNLPDRNINNTTPPADRQDHSYEKVYQRHVDELASVISQAKIDEKSNVKKTKRSHPKLEIKIVPTQTTTTEDVEQNCGDITPVITYNHVTSTDDAQPLFQPSSSGAISPGSSSKGSRSPSPLLEVPTTGGEIFTKFPTAEYITTKESTTTTNRN